MSIGKVKFRCKDTTFFEIAKFIFKNMRKIAKFIFYDMCKIAFFINGNTYQTCLSLPSKETIKYKQKKTIVPDSKSRHKN